MRLWKKAAICITATEVRGNASGLLTFSSIADWYSLLERPPGTPPNGLFGPVWLTLYGMMGYALALVWDRSIDLLERNRAIKWFVIQFALNLTWSPAFFGLHQMGLAMGIIILLLVAIVITTRKFFKIRPLAGRLMIPYLLWVAYATYLNAGFGVLNGW